jgi:hypothetical protein
VGVAVLVILIVVAVAAAPIAPAKKKKKKKIPYQLPTTVSAVVSPNPVHHGGNVVPVAVSGKVTAKGNCKAGRTVSVGIYGPDGSGSSAKTVVSAPDGSFAATNLLLPANTTTYRVVILATAASASFGKPKKRHLCLVPPRVELALTAEP